jgi:hypothetical protein
LRRRELAASRWKALLSAPRRQRDNGIAEWRVGVSLDTTSSSLIGGTTPAALVEVYILPP